MLHNILQNTVDIYIYYSVNCHNKYSRLFFYFIKRAEWYQNKNLNYLFQLFPAGTIIKTDSLQQNILVLTKQKFLDHILFSQDPEWNISLILAMIWAVTKRKWSQIHCFVRFGYSECSNAGWEYPHLCEILCPGLGILEKKPSQLNSCRPYRFSHWEILVQQVQCGIATILSLVGWSGWDAIRNAEMFQALEMVHPWATERQSSASNQFSIFSLY